MQQRIIDTAYGKLVSEENYGAIYLAADDSDKHFYIEYYDVDSNGYVKHIHTNPIYTSEEAVFGCKFDAKTTFGSWLVSIVFASEDKVSLKRFLSMDTGKTWSLIAEL